MIYAKEINGQVSIFRALPTNYKINGIRHNLSVLSIETINAEGFYELIVPTVTEYQRLEDLLPTDLVGTQYIQRVYTFDQDEIDAKIEADAEQSALNIVSQRTRDGEDFFNKVATKVKRSYDDGNINQSQFKNIRTSLKDVLLPLRFGDWDLAQDNINAVTRPSGQLGGLYDFLKNKIDQYVLDNY